MSFQFWTSFTNEYLCQFLLKCFTLHWTYTQLKTKQSMCSRNSSMASVCFSSTCTLYSLFKKRPWEITRNSNCKAREFQANRTHWCLAWITWLGKMPCLSQKPLPPAIGKNFGQMPLGRRRDDNTWNWLMHYILFQVFFLETARNKPCTS